MPCLHVCRVWAWIPNCVAHRAVKQGLTLLTVIPSAFRLSDDEPPCAAADLIDQCWAEGFAGSGIIGTKRCLATSRGHGQLWQVDGDHIQVTHLHRASRGYLRYHRATCYTRRCMPYRHASRQAMRTPGGHTLRLHHGGSSDCCARTHSSGAAEHVTANRGHRAVRTLTEPRPRVQMHDHLREMQGPYTVATVGQDFRLPVFWRHGHQVKVLSPYAVATSLQGWVMGVGSCAGMSGIKRCTGIWWQTSCRPSSCMSVHLLFFDGGFRHSHT